MFVWCMLLININYSGEIIKTETAVKGKVIKQEKNIYFIDFSEYAIEKDYLGNWDKPIQINKDKCVED